MARPSLSETLREKFFAISKLAVGHPWLTICTWVAVAVAGIFAFSSLKYALFPDFTFPVAVVNARAPVETVLETEAALTIPLENSLADIDAINNVLTTTYLGRTVMVLRYRIGTDLDSVVALTEAALGEAPLPESAELDTLPLNINEEVAISYAILTEGDISTTVVNQVETEIVPALEEITGVLRVDLVGTGAPDRSPSLASGDQPIAAQAESPATLVRFNGEDSLAVQVVKQGNANTLEVVQKVENTVADLQTEFPQLTLALATTQANYIREATQATIEALWLAIALAILVIFAFLRNWRATLITALVIPLSLLATFIVMALAGFNLETITLLALALVIGIIVDDAIVEVENIMRHLDAGEPPRQAVLAASREISLTVSVSTLTIVAVFLPVAFMGGTVGQFFKPFGLTVSAAVIASLLLARTLTPVLALYWLRSRRFAANGYAEADPGIDTVLVPDNTDRGVLIRGYASLLQWALGHRGIVVAGAITALCIGVMLIPLVPTGFIPKLDRGEFNIAFTGSLPGLAEPAIETLPPDLTGLAPEDLNQLPPNLQAQVQDNDPSALSTNPVQTILDQSREVTIELENTALAIPEVNSVFTVIGGRGAPNQGQLYVQLNPDRELSTAEVQEVVRSTLPDLPDVTVSVEDVPFIDAGGEKPLEVILYSDDLEALDATSQDVRAQVASLPDFVDVTVAGVERAGQELTSIERRNRQRVAYIRANLSENQALGDATHQVLTIAKATIPDSVTLGLGADSARVGEVLGGFLQTLGFSVLCMLVVLFLPFGRLLEPLVVGLSLPLAIVGAMMGFLVTQSNFGMASVIGLLFLLGLLDKNALLLMDYANQLRQTGLTRMDALMKTGPVRFRPILMTTASTILGMLPLALGWGVGAELRQPMAVAIIGGLITSTLLSLLVVPVLYTLLEDGWMAVQGKRAAKRKEG
jgi:multidrug efflux pump subunit AcrB